MSYCSGGSYTPGTRTIDHCTGGCTQLTKAYEPILCIIIIVNTREFTSG